MLEELIKRLLDRAEAAFMCGDRRQSDAYLADMMALVECPTPDLRPLPGSPLDLAEILRLNRLGTHVEDQVAMLQRQSARAAKLIALSARTIATTGAATAEARRLQTTSRALVERAHSCTRRNPLPRAA